MLRHKYRIAVVLLTFIWIVAVSYIAVLRHEFFFSNLWDLGWLEQVVWNTSRGDLLQTSVRGVPTGNYLVEHVSFVPLLLAPLYRLLPGAEILLVAQTTALGLGALIYYRICRLICKNYISAILLTVAYLTSPLVINVALYDLHYISFVVPLLMLAFYSLLTRHDRLVLISGVAALFVKEEVALTVAALGLVAWLRTRKQSGRLLIGLAGSYFLVVALVNYLFVPAGPLTRLGGYRYPLNLHAQLALLPWKIRYLVGSVGMFGFLPLLSGVVLTALPALLYNAASTFTPQLSWSYQYSAVLIPPLFISATEGIKKIASWFENRFHVQYSRVSFIISALFLVVTIANLLFVGNPLLFTTTTGLESLSRRHVRGAALSYIPDHASVAAGNSLGAHLAQRRELYDFPRFPFRADWVVFDTWNTVDEGFEGEEFYHRQIGELGKHGFRLVADIDDVMVYGNSHNLSPEEITDEP